MVIEFWTKFPAFIWTGLGPLESLPQATSSTAIYSLIPALQIASYALFLLLHLLIIPGWLTNPWHEYSSGR
jgi:putative exporter of polyketide antibiotics